ncbi:uncharacterized protein LOC129985270 isoform X2 [Argiope bruennichi]|uniref:uncharacterized protein LOC129985270 isoform X2 n=1 Tax=Argiope bruennichi TaxID=94029 RepID=UPI002494F079|nr:uncharacterized protein LOC129985270 isoform X2 [Argiope bruennichi]
MLNTHFCQMDSDAQITLADRAAVVVAAAVWYHKNAVERIKKSTSCKRSFEQRYWMKTKIIVNKNIHSLPLPASCKQRVESFIVFVGEGIEQWIQDHYFLTINSSVLSSLLSWNPKGVIDCIATAKNIISHEKNLISCFRIACMYCLENYIFQLWDLLEQQNLPYDTDAMECFEIKFWISYIKDNMDDLMDEIQYTGNRDTLFFAFNMSVKNNNAIWTEHFLKKMKEDQMCTVACSKLKSILEMPCSFQENIKHKMIPLLSQYVSSEMFNGLIVSHSGTILYYYLQFSTIGDFLKIAYKTRDVLMHEDFYLIIEKMAHILQEYGGNQIFENAFELFWKNSPDHCKTYIIEKCINSGFLIKLGVLEHSSPIIKAIIQTAATSQRKEMIFSYGGIIFFDTLMQKNRWGCFSMSIQELVGSHNRENWINKLIHTYRRMLKNCSFPSYTSTDYKKFIHAFEIQKHKKGHLKK